MRSAADMILHDFICRQPEDLQNRLLQFLPDSVRERMKNLPTPSSAPITGFENGALLEKVHWSWFLPTLKSYSPDEQSLFLSALGKEAAQSLADEIPCKWTEIALTPMAKSYLRQVLLDSLLGPHDRLLPVEFLPASPMNELLLWPLPRLIWLIDLLSMHDLAVEMRQIVETKILKKIYSFLTEAQSRLLKITAAKHELIAQPKFGLDRWDGTAESLQNLLHRRGLARLGWALSGEDLTLAWHVCHRLDIGRGSLLAKMCKEELGAPAVKAAAKQVVELLGSK